MKPEYVFIGSMVFFLALIIRREYLGYREKKDTRKRMLYRQAELIAQRRLENE